MLVRVLRKERQPWDGIRRLNIGRNLLETPLESRASILFIFNIFIYIARSPLLGPPLSFLKP
jgi:hypothetical protein